MTEKQLGHHIDVKKQKFWTHVFQSALVLFIIVGVLARYWQNDISAAEISNRSINLSSSAAGQAAMHTFTYTLAGGSSVGSVVFEYCSNSPLFEVACVAPTGLDVSSAILNSQSGEIGFSINAPLTTSSKVVINRVSPSVTIAGQSSYSFNGVINPDIAGESYYVRISAHNSIDGSGLPTDYGSVVFTLTTDLTIGAYIPPYIAFCVGKTIGPNCTNVSGFDLSMGDLSESATATQTTQISGATNVVTGYTVYVLGYTLTAGTNVIPAMNVAAASVVGTSQFGINARANSAPSIGQEPQGLGSLTPVGAYAVPNTFKYVSGEAIAQSATVSDYNTLTISYIANASSSQPAGVYTTTLTYVATSTF